MNENAFLGGGSSSVSSSLPSTNVGNSRSRGAARPGTPALSAQTISTYTNSQPRASKRSNTNSSSAGAGSKSRRSVRGDPYAASGSMRLRNRKLGNRKLGRESLHNKPTVPHILSKKQKKTDTSNNKKTFKTRNSKKKSRRKSRPASADSWNKSNSPKSKNTSNISHGTTSTSSHSKTNSANVKSAYAQQNMRPNSASAATVGSKTKKKVASSIGGNATSTTAGTIAGFIHRFRGVGGASTPEDRNGVNTSGVGGANGNQVWWKRGAGHRKESSMNGAATKDHHKFKPSTPERTTTAQYRKNGGGKKSLHKSKNKSNKSYNNNVQQKPTQQEVKTHTARGSGLEAVSALRRRQTDIPESTVPESKQTLIDGSIKIASLTATEKNIEEDDLDRRATELLQRCDAMLTGSPEATRTRPIADSDTKKIQPLAATSTPPTDTTDTFINSATTSSTPTPPSANSTSTSTIQASPHSLTPTSTLTSNTIKTTNTLASVEKRSQQVLADADRLLNAPKLNVTVKPHYSMLDQLIGQVVASNLFGSSSGGWCRFGHMLQKVEVSKQPPSYVNEETRTLERLEQNLVSLTAH